MDLRDMNERTHTFEKRPHLRDMNKAFEYYALFVRECDPVDEIFYLLGEANTKGEKPRDCRTCQRDCGQRRQMW